MRRLEQNGDILIRGLLISGIAVVMTVIVEIHPVTGTGENYDYYYAEGQIAGKADCDKGLKYNPNGHEDSGDYGFTDGYQDGWTLAGCSLDSSKKKK
ncbi:MAG TPA: hypothetical protein VJ697_05545 [Nitrososphaeraceae archaeon]|nr:hypothetical protein [Nitrososphaeraceae archaeon]